MKKGEKIFLFFLIAEIIFLFGWWWRIQQDIIKMDGEVEKARMEIQKIREENKNLKEMEKKIKDPFFVEKIAREKLGLARKNEIIYRIVPSH